MNQTTQGHDQAPPANPSGNTESKHSDKKPARPALSNVRDITDDFIGKGIIITGVTPPPKKT